MTVFSIVKKSVGETMEDSSEVLVCAAEYIKGEIDICVGLCGCHNIVPLNEYI